MEPYNLEHSRWGQISLFHNQSSQIFSLEYPNEK